MSEVVDDWPVVLPGAGQPLGDSDDLRELRDFGPSTRSGEAIVRSSRSARLTSFGSVRTARQRWFWRGVMPLGGVSLLAGRGDVGKSTFALHLAGQATHGTLEGDLAGPTDVLLVSHEDPLATVVVPRAVANGVDLRRMHHLAIEAESRGGATVPKLPLDADLLRDAIERTRAGLVIFDPITSTLDGDNDKVRDVRAVLDTLALIGEETGATIAAIAHFRKGSAGSSSDFLSGSHAYRDSARAVILFARDREEGDVVMSLDKGNYSKGDWNLSYRLDSAKVATDDGDETEVGRVVVLGATERSVASVVAQENAGQYGELRTELLSFILAAPGAVSTKEIMAEFSEPEYRRATVAMNLSRLVKTGKVDQPIRGQYQKPNVTTPLGVRQV